MEGKISCVCPFDSGAVKVCWKSWFGIVGQNRSSRRIIIGVWWWLTNYYGGWWWLMVVIPCLHRLSDFILPIFKIMKVKKKAIPPSINISLHVSVSTHSNLTSNFIVWMYATKPKTTWEKTELAFLSCFVLTAGTAPCLWEVCQSCIGATQAGKTDTKLLMLIKRLMYYSITVTLKDYVLHSLLSQHWFCFWMGDFQNTRHCYIQLSQAKGIDHCWYYPCSATVCWTDPGSVYASSW